MEGMDISSSNIDMYGNNSNQNNSLQKNMDTISLENPTLSYIPSKLITSTSEMVTIQEIRNAMKSFKIVYPNKDEIPLIKIKDENYLESGERIVDYVGLLTQYDDNKFNICIICKKYNNKYYCNDCNKNICNICHKNCISNNHKQIDLSKEFNTISNYIKNIREIFEKDCILTKNKKDNNEKQTNNYNSFDEYEMNNEIEKKPKDYTYDILLIEAIIDKDYTNYFHYQNIEECFNYLVRKSAINSISEKSNKQNDFEFKKNEIDIDEDSEDNNDYITIKYKIIKGDRKIKIFGKEFCNKYKNICKIIYENKKYKLKEYFELNKIETKNIFEIKLTKINRIKEAKNIFDRCYALISLPDISKWNTNNVNDMSYMFYGCSSLESLPDISKWNTNNVTNMNSMFGGCELLKLLPDWYNF